MRPESGEHGRPSPEEFLRRIELEERQRQRGHLKVFLGYASGVGKSTRMLDEGRRRKQRGQDVVVAATQASDSSQAEELLRQFEIIPALVSEGGEAIDVGAVLRRRPEIVLVDGLAYSNPRGSRHPQRWQDVEDVLAAGISVVTSVNLQFVAEKQAQVAAIIGRSVGDSVPESFLRTADEIEIVDAPPEYCMSRLAGADPSTADVVRLERQLSELREIALLLAAEVVDQQLGDYLRRAGIEHVYGTHERILVCITPHSSAALMIHRGRRQADRFHGELYVVHARQQLNEADQAVLAGNLALARSAGAVVEVLDDGDPVHAILEFARKHGITQIFVGHGEPRGLARLRASLIERLILDAEGIDVRVFPRQ